MADKVLTKRFINVTHPRHLGVIVKDDGFCDFSGRVPSKEEYSKFMAQAKLLSEGETNNKI